MTLTENRFRRWPWWEALSAFTVVSAMLLALGVHFAATSEALPCLFSGSAGCSGSGGSDLKGPLSTRGRYIVDANGNRVKLQSGNWHGSSGTWTGSGDDEDPANNAGGEIGHRAPLGLDRVPMDKIVKDFKALGLNSIRLPFSNEMISDTRPVVGLTANPSLNGLKPLEVYDRAVKALTDAGLGVILNNHTTTTKWCCSNDGNEFWNSGQDTGKWVDDWAFMAARYKGNPGVIGADLRNEIRRTTWNDPNWGWGDNQDWEAAAHQAGDRILTTANPNLLVIIEGLNWTGIPSDLFPHERPMLKPVAGLSETLTRSHKLVYSAHFYGYIGPNHTGATGLGETHDTRFREMSRDDLFKSMDELAGYVATTPDKTFTAPVWVSEFGVGTQGSDQDKAWFSNMVDYLIARDLEWAYWPIVGFQQPNNPQADNWGLLRYAADGNLKSVTDSGDWRGVHFRRLLDAAGKTGQVAPVRTWSMLYGIHEDRNESLRAGNDWDPGARKMVCPDDQRMIGISDRGQGGLCTDTNEGDLWRPGTQANTVNTEKVDTDWASGFTKYQCQTGQFMIGYSLHGDGMSAILCAPARISLAGAGRTLWIDKGDNRPASGEGGDFAPGYYKGQCNSDEYAAGIAFSWANLRYGHPDALYCRKLK
ncbi:cellulase family glycosylhydrolase [Nocardia tengchongensis]|uniref:Cellulase family glycosylhydrolase n=1 Tax=Nocardia tengchongensis TaxID=2055889 RepID=A0ABX8CTR4_9NOCA|nr:cellulase family glycosylhydrolase [Nocardia tengchongensis]QVI23302.1 cellulase family glycosylhydrolase [Nocardia tengchongensis]